MIADLKPYPAMKDSGVPWLGPVPEQWAVLPHAADAWFDPASVRIGYETQSIVVLPQCGPCRQVREPRRRPG